MQSSVAGVLAEGAAAHPERTLFSFSGGDGRQREHYTYGSFLLRVNEVAGALKEMGVGAGEPALLVYPPGLEMAVAFFACIWIGAVPVPAPPPSKARSRSSWSRLAHIARHAGARFGLAPADLVRRAGDAGEDSAAELSALKWIATDAIIGGRSGILVPRPSDILFIQYTSGSTSAPRGVAVTNANVLHNAGLSVDHLQPIGVSWLPHFHDMGLLGYFLHSLVRDGEAHCFSPVDFLRRPVLWLEMISRVRATITSAPNAAYEYCLREDKVAEADLDGIDLSSLRMMANCAEPVRPGTFERFLERFSRHGLRAGSYVAGYGLAEHTLCVTFGGRRRLDVGAPDGASKEGPHQLVSCGRPAPDVDVKIVDIQSRRPVAEGVIGEIWVDSPSKAAGYWRAPELTREHFEARLADDPGSHAYLRTGDLGLMSEGELYVCGRLRDMLVLNGRNVFPADIEALIEEQFTKSLAGRVVAFGIPDPDAGTERLVILVEAGADAPSLEAIRLAVEHGSGVPVGTIARVARGTIIRTSSGKIARAQCSENWRKGLVDAIESLSVDTGGSATDAAGLIAALVARAEALGDADATLEQLGLDSIALVNFSLALEGLLEEEGLASPELLERAADLSLLQAVRVSELAAAHAMLRSGTVGAEAIVSLLNEVGGYVRGEEHARMRADSELPLPAIASSPSAVRGDGIFLTGATGFLGSHLLRSLLELTGEPVTVLVRGNSQLHCAARIRDALLETDMPADAVRRALHSCITVVAGDLSQPLLGLAKGDFEALTRSVSRIYHCGAEVDYVKSYNLLRATNVEATRDIIALASQGRRKSLHYLSTTFVFGWSVKPLLLEDERNAKMENLDFGYAQSKWVAEQLVLRAADAGLETVVYRPSLVTASASARFVRRDIVARVLGYMIRHGLTVDATNQISFLPVDVCTRNIVALSMSGSAPLVVHMTSDEYHNMGDVCRAVEERYGYPFRETGLAAFVAHAHAHCTPEDELYPLLSFLDRNTPRILRMGRKRYDSSAYRAARDLAPLSLPHPDLARTVDPIVRFLQNEGLVPASPREPEAQFAVHAKRPQPALAAS